MANNVQITNPTAWAMKIIGFFMSVALMVSSFFLKTAWDNITNLEMKLHKLEIVLTERTSNKFSSEDWIREKVILDSNYASMNARLIRLEESIPYIKESLDEIKHKINTR